MEVARARLTCPYKVGHFFTSAGPLRADLVKIRNASRDLAVRRVLARGGGGTGAIYGRPMHSRSEGGAGYIGRERVGMGPPGWVEIYISIYIHMGPLCTSLLYPPYTLSPTLR